VARLDDARWIEKLAAEPLLLRMPLVRWQQRVTLGEATAEWTQWISAAKAT
jgi:arsenate reductase-like glutaredoxin family protein